MAKRLEEQKAIRITVVKRNQRVKKSKQFLIHFGHNSELFNSWRGLAIPLHKQLFSPITPLAQTSTSEHRGTQHRGTEGSSFADVVYGMFDIQCKMAFRETVNV